jgi:23S rRNA (cytosine1962-C5)-methyltransferase
MNKQTEYRLLDAGNGRKLEQFGQVVLDRPCAQAVWRPCLTPEAWAQADASFTRDEGKRWQFHRPLPESWQVSIDGLLFEVQPTDFGHVGVFPEHVRAWRWLADLQRRLAPGREPLSVLNLFAYSGGATVAAARLGFRVCHLDASHKMVTWARRNAGLNDLSAAPVRWIVDDVQKFLKREPRRGAAYDGIILDPPSFGRGSRQELFKIDTHLLDLMGQCREVLSREPTFVFLSCHTPGYTPLVLQHLLNQGLSGLNGSIEAGEMVLEGGPGVLPVPSGTYAVWSRA